MYEDFKVVFVDDDSHILASIKRCLIDEDFKSYFFTSGQSALEFMEKVKVDVVVTDMRMPEMNGLQLLQTVTERWPLVVKIVLTGFTQISQILATINQINLFKFLAKPWVNDELLLMLHQSLDFARLLADNERYKKMLEVQNKTYKTVLTESDETVNFARNSIKVLRAFGMGLIPFGQDLPPLQRLHSEIDDDLKVELYNNFSEAVTNSAAEYSADELTELVRNRIKTVFPGTVIKSQANEDRKLSLNIKLLDSVLFAVHLLFGEDFKTNGVNAYSGLMKAGKYTIMLQSGLPKEQVISDDRAALLKTRLALLISCYQEALRLCKMTLETQQSGGNIIISLDLNLLADSKKAPEFS